MEKKALVITSWVRKRFLANAALKSQLGLPKTGKGLYLIYIGNDSMINLIVEYVCG